VSLYSTQSALVSCKRWGTFDTGSLSRTQSGPFPRAAAPDLQRADLAHDDWRPRLAADVLWALALAHHWTPRLPHLEALLQRLGGFPALTAREAASTLWAFATLGHVPTALLQVRCSQQRLTSAQGRCNPIVDQCQTQCS
jgi:hypothetical protein